MIKGKTDRAPPPPPGDGGSPPPGGDIGSNPGASESQRFQNGGEPAQRPDYVPEKFWKDGKVATEDVLKSYAELEAWKNTKNEDLLKQLDADRLKARPEAPEKYEIAPIEGVEMKELVEHPSVKWWRETAFGLALPPDKFNEGIASIVEVMRSSGVDEEKEMAALGENAAVRIEAVSVWAQKEFTDPAEFEAIQRIGQTAAGIRVIEKMMGKTTGGDGNQDPPVVPGLTVGDLKAMQADPRYWNPAKRDPAFVAKVDEGFEKLYGGKK